MGKELIRVWGAREHNLRGVDLEVPRESLVVFTGVSGSGKSSLAYDTIFKEGQRLFLQSLSAYARQFLGQLERPRVDGIEGLGPAISIDQRGRGRNPRSTVGTITELFDHLRLLFARLGEPHCPRCRVPIESLAPGEIAERLMVRAQGERVVILAPMVRERKGEYRKELADWLAQGFVRARIDGEIVRLEDAPELDRYVIHTIELVVDRVLVDRSRKVRIRDSIERALALTGGTVGFLRSPGGGERSTLPGAQLLPGGEVYERQSTARACPVCGFSLPEIEPRLFSFNAPQGACPTCHGLGYRRHPVPERVVTAPDLPLPGAIGCLTDEGKVPFVKLGMPEIEAVARVLGVDVSRPWRELPGEFKELVLHGSGSRTFELEYTFRRRGRRYRRKRSMPFRGILPALALAYSWTSARFLERCMETTVCPDCQGTRLRPEARAVTFGGHHLGELASMSLERLLGWAEGVELGVGEEAAVGGPLMKEIRSRLRLLVELGLGYLTLDRSAGSLSGGEYQRIKLARQLGSRLQGVLYVLDEPTVGLHPRDNQRLVRTLGELRDLGNTVLVVEHDEDTMRAADLVVELGPDAGRLGGRVVALGSPDQVAAQDTHTGRFLAGRERIPVPERRRIPTGELVIRGARANNLEGIDVHVPLGVLVAVTGVSGSGKSSLVDLTLKRALTAHFHKHARLEPGPHDRIDGLGLIDKVIEIDQDPIGRTPRSNPGTYTKVFDHIRELFASLPESRARGFSKGRFSFNVPGGRCEECKGAGVKLVEMQLLAPVLVTCEVCEGRRFNRETLEITYKGLDISQVLDLTIDRAREVFAAIPKISATLDVLSSVGLGYVKLGQPSPTLSGGEAQRMKLASELRRPATGRTLYILDEPTTGLHAADVAMLLEALQRLVDEGNTVLVVEHNMELVKAADHVIELGPGGGEAGGRVIATGTPEDLASNASTPTGEALARVLTERAGQDERALSMAAEALAEYRGPTQSAMAPRARMRDIHIVGASKHNLAGIDVTIPGESLTVITGVSGSGKSSLAFHTLFAEGQRRYVDSLSTYARRFLGRMSDPQVERLEGLAPAIAIDQKTAPRSPRSTVATATELHDYLRVLYARIGRPHCPVCGRELVASSPSRAAARARAEFGEGTRVLVTIAGGGGRTREELVALGVTRILVPGPGGFEVVKVAHLNRDGLPKGAEPILDRCLAGAGARLAEAVARGYDLAGGLVTIRVHEDPTRAMEVTRSRTCPDHGIQVHDELSPRHFSFNHYKGACPTCSGLGFMAKVRSGRRGRRGRRPGEPEIVPTGELCPTCHGERLGPVPRAVTVGGIRLPELTSMTVAEALASIEGMELGPHDREVAEDLLREIIGRLTRMVQLGVGYLGLDRATSTLSGGEAQRIRLATQLGSGLTGCVYVLDEPTVGLHPADTGRLLDTLRGLRDQGNTVVVVEHDRDTMVAADHIVDLGPGPGEHGGRVVAQGTPAQVAEVEESLTGAYLAGRLVIPVPEQRRAGRGELVVRGARANNLAGVDAAFPFAAVTCVTGVSGSGKSSLVLDVLARALGARVGQAMGRPGEHDGVEGAERVRRVVLVDQSPIGRSPKSNPATYTGLMDHVRKLFASLPESQARGYRAGRFSYNRAEGQCPVCKGAGAIQKEMHFLSDVWLTCDACKGKRYNQATLEVRYGGMNIADVLDSTVEQAAKLFANHRGISRICARLLDVGLGYLRLGQPATTLSGGEAQRLKIAAELGRRTGEGTVYVLDEPTTGLHPADVVGLVDLLHRLADKGAAVVVIEHNPELVKTADRIVDLGPGPGPDGGRVVAQGTPEEVVRVQESHTGRYLEAYLARRA